MPQHLYRLVEVRVSPLTTTELVGSLIVPGDRGVRFDCSDACCQLVEVREVGFVYRKALMRLVGVRRVFFGYRKACWSFSRMNEWIKLHILSPPGL